MRFGSKCTFQMFFHANKIMYQGDTWVYPIGRYVLSSLVPKEKPVHEKENRKSALFTQRESDSIGTTYTFVTCSNESIHFAVWGHHTLLLSFRRVTSSEPVTQQYMRF